MFQSLWWGWVSSWCGGKAFKIPFDMQTLWQVHFRSVKVSGGFPRLGCVKSISFLWLLCTSFDIWGSVLNLYNPSRSKSHSYSGRLDNFLFMSREMRELLISTAIANYCNSFFFAALKSISNHIFGKTSPCSINLLLNYCPPLWTEIMQLLFYFFLKIRIC